MQVHVKFFAQLRERLGSGRPSTLRTGTTVAAVWAGIVAEQPALAKVPVRFAVNERYVNDTHKLADGDELAVFPPVSGGSATDGVGT